MKRISPILLGMSLAVAATSLAGAQQDATTATMPKVLQLTREFIKAGKAGMMHDRSEAAFVQSFARAKWPTHYIALSSLSGKSRALYITPYGSFADWEKDSKSIDKNTALSAGLEKAAVADGDLLDSMDQAVFTYAEDLSYRPKGDLSHARYLEVTTFHVRPGHRKQWHEVVKLVRDAHEKAGTSAHWGTFELAYGGEDGTYLVLSQDASMGEIDKGFAEDKQFQSALGEEGMKKLDELYGAAVDHAQSELFSINPRQSYVDEAWIKADPEFWKPKGAETASTKPAAKQAPKPAATMASKPSSR